jgi:hypothetical protein
MKVMILPPIQALYQNRIVGGELVAPYVVVDLDDELAASLIRAGQAEALHETAMVAPRENAMRPRGRPRKTGEV